MSGAASIVSGVRGRARTFARKSRVILRQGGLSRFGLYLREELIRNSLTEIRMRFNSASTGALHCPICDYRGPRFLTHVGAGYVVDNAMCPRCRSFPRHRGFTLLLERELAGYLENLPKNGLRLMFAPELSIERVLSSHVEGLEGVDIAAVNNLVVYREDLISLGFDDESADFVSCFHVVEHVRDDQVALSELRRILKAEGLMILNVPVTFGRWETVSFEEPNPLLNDHYFDYGEDFSTKLSESGFSGVGYRFSSVFTQDVFVQLGLQDEIIYVLKKSDAPGSIVDHRGLSLLARSSS